MDTRRRVLQTRLRGAVARRVRPVPESETSCQGPYQAVAGPLSPVPTGRPLLDAVSAPPAAEIALGLLLIRVILPLTIAALTIWAHVRISIALRTRLELPANMKAQLKAFEHQVTEFDESLSRHVGKDAARWARIEKTVAAASEPAAATAAPSLVPGAAPAPTGPTVPMSVWNDANEPQRQAWRMAGQAPAEAS